MPDDQGRLHFGEMRQAVWENLAASYPGSVDPVTGEAFNPIVDPLFTKQAIDRWLNESLTKHSSIIMENNEQLLEDSVTLDVLAGVREIELPEDLGMFRSAWWKDPSTPYVQAPPTPRSFMFNIDDPAFVVHGIPGYRLTLDNILIDPVSDVDNLQGIEVRYIKWLNYLSSDEQIIETQFARILQECIILDAAIKGTTRKAFLDATELRTDYAEFRDSLIRMARGYFAPTSQYVTTTHPIKLRGASLNRPGRTRWFMD